MKTKEIEVWMHKKFIDGQEWFPVYPIRVATDDYVKAKLIIEIPERKVDITESEFDEAVKDYDLHNPCLKTFSGAMEHIKQKLFGDKHE